MVGLKPSVLGKAVRVWPVDPTFPQQAKPGCEVGLVPRALNKENRGGKRRSPLEGREELAPRVFQAPTRAGPAVPGQTALGG